MNSTTKPASSKGLSQLQAAVGLARLTSHFTESTKTARPGDVSPIEMLVRGLGEISNGLVAGNKGLSVASAKKVLLSYEIGGMNGRARIGDYINLELSQTFTAAQARTILAEAVRKVRGKWPFSLLRGAIETKVEETSSGLIQIRIMDACDIDSKGSLYGQFPSMVARRANLAASIRDAVLEKAKASGAKVVEFEGSWFF